MNILISSLKLIGILTSLQMDWTDELQKPHRFYHNLRHIDHMLTTLARVEELTIEETVPYIAAIWLHDIHYNPKFTDNEERSADRAVKDLKNLGIDVKLVKEIILNTKHHEGGSPTLDLFCDLDLFILGESRDVYDRYMRNIRREYSFVPQEVYFEKRLEVLNKFDQSDVFKTKFFEPYEEQAHANLNYEVDQLWNGTLE